MKKLLVVGVIVLFLGLAIAPSINANISKTSLEPVSDIEVLEEDNATPVELVFQLIAKLSNNREIQKLVADTDAEVDIQKEINSIIEKDEELNTIVEKIKGSDCGCNDANTTRWSFPVLCLLLFPLQCLAFGLAVRYGQLTLWYIMFVIGVILNCIWSIATLENILDISTTTE